MTLTSMASSQRRPTAEDLLMRATIRSRSSSPIEWNISMVDCWDLCIKNFMVWFPARSRRVSRDGNFLFATSSFASQYAERNAFLRMVSWAWSFCTDNLWNCETRCVCSTCTEDLWLALERWSPRVPGRIRTDGFSQKGASRASPCMCFMHKRQNIPLSSM